MLFKPQNGRLELVSALETQRLVPAFYLPKSFKPEGLEISALAADPDGRRLFFAVGRLDKVFELRLTPGGPQIGASFTGGGFVYYDGALATTTTRSLHLYVDGQEVVSRRSPFLLIRKFTSLAYAAPVKKIYGVNFLSGVLFSLDAKTLETVDQIPLKHGIRFVQYNPKYGKLFVGNYINGEVDIIDPITNRIEYHYDFGYRLLNPSLSNDLDSLYVPCAAGIFRLDLRQIWPG
jgi:hypothetical protein